MQKQKLLVITSYPPKQKEWKGAGLSYYSKLTLFSFAKAAKNLEVSVLAEKALGEGANYTENGIHITRLWSKNSFATFFTLFAEIYKNHKKTSKILIEFDFTLFGSILYLLPLPFFLLILRLLKKDITVVFHHGGIDEYELYRKDHDAKAILLFIYSLFAKSMYRTIMTLAARAIVFEEAMKDKLKQYGRTRKIVVIPNGVPEFKHTPDKRTARTHFGFSKNQFVVLFFGFLSWHKGSDWLIDAVGALNTHDIRLGKKEARKQIHLVVAGGANPAYLASKHYERYTQSIEKKCDKRNITLTGFVDEADIPWYFQAADVVVFPYRTLLHSTPLSLAFSFKKPFLVSEKMQGILRSPDITSIMRNLKITKEKASFLLNQDFLRQLLYLQNNIRARRKLTELSRNIAHARSWNRLGRRYYEEIFGVELLR